LSASQIRSNLLHHFRSVCGPLSTDRIGLDILVEAFVRIQRRTMARQVEHADTFLMGLKPTFDLSRTMHRMTIDDQKHLLGVLLNQPTQKMDHHRCRESLGKYHKGQSTPVGNGGDHVAAKALTGTWHHRCVSFETITASGLVIRSHSHFIAPVYLCPFLTSLASNGRVVFFQPAFDRFWILFVGTTKRFLGCEAPSFQIAAHRPDRNRDAKPFLDQLSNGISGPQGKRQSQLVGTALADQTHHRSRLMTRQARLAFGATFVRGQCRVASFSMRLEPIVNRRPSHTEQAAGLGLSHPLFENGVNHSTSQFVLGLWRKSSAVAYRHSSSYDYTNPVFNTLCSN